MYTNTQSTFQCFKSGGQSAGWGCRVSLAQLCQRRLDTDGGPESKLKYGSTVTRTHTFTRGLDNVCTEQWVVPFPSTSSWTRSQAKFISLCSVFGTKPYKKRWSDLIKLPEVKFVSVCVLKRAPESVFSSP